MLPYRYRPTFSRYLAAAIGLVCLVAFTLIAVQERLTSALQTLPWLVLVSGAAWAFFWRPAVEVDDGGVRLVNVWRTIDLSWPAIQRIDTKWALALTTKHGTFTAWAAPAPSRMAAARLSRQDTKGLPETTYLAGDAIRPGDAPGSPSGDVAQVIRVRWEQLRDAGYLDSGVVEQERATVSWHWELFVGAIALMAAGVLAGL